MSEQKKNNKETHNCMYCGQVIICNQKYINDRWVCRCEGTEIGEEGIQYWCDNYCFHEYRGY